MTNSKHILHKTITHVSISTDNYNTNVRIEIGAIYYAKFYTSSHLAKLFNFHFLQFSSLMGFSILIEIVNT